MSAIKLTDTQLVILSAAAQRHDGAVELSPKLKGGAAQKVIAKLLSGGLAEEIRARGTLPVWRRDENGGFALRITKRGLRAIHADPEAEGLSSANQSSQKDQLGNDDGVPVKSSTRLKDAARRNGADLGESQPAEDASVIARPARTSLGNSEQGRDHRRPARTDTKQAKVVAMLQTPCGATIPTIMEATGWQPHSVRGFLAGYVRKRLGLELVSSKDGPERVYRIVGPNSTTTAKPSRRAA